jgi:GntR family transcriptional regulator
MNQPGIDAPLAASDLQALDRFWRAGARGLPKYALLRDALSQAIASGHWKPGTKLPPEAELARHTPFSLGTVQRALRMLADDGLIVRQQGSGTYVARPRKQMDEPWHCRFVSQDGTGFLPVYPHVLGRHRIHEGGPWSEHLGGAGPYIRIDRVMAIADALCAYSRFYLDEERFSALLATPLAALEGRNLKKLIAREFGLPVTRISQTFRTVRFPDEICRALALRARSRCNLLEIGAAAGRERPLYFQELYIPFTELRLVVSDTYEPEAAATPRGSATLQEQE